MQLQASRPSSLCIILVRRLRTWYESSTYFTVCADCGTTLVLDEEVREMLRKRVPERGAEIDKMTFGEITEYVGSIAIVLAD